MKKILGLVVLLVTSVLVAACGDGGGRTYASCDTPDGTQACFNAEDMNYRIEDALKEDGATLTIGLDNGDWGNSIVEAWNKAYPELKGKVVFVDYETSGAADKITEQAGEAPDVVFVIDGEVPRNMQSVYALHDYMKDMGEDNGFKPANELINSGNYVYLPTAFDGMAFSWNKTMLTELGYNVEDADEDGLPDAFDTWEEIFALADEWNTTRPTYNDKKVNVVYPMSLTEVWSGYSSVTSEGWEIFAEGDATKPGYDKDSFKNGLAFIKEAADHKISVEADGTLTPGTSMSWRWDNYLNDEFSPFALVGTWMDVEDAEETSGSDFKFSVMPTYKGTRLTPFVKTKGFVINANTSYPSAAHELLRLIYSEDGFQALVDNSSYIPGLEDDSDFTPKYEGTNRKEMSAAFAENYVEPNFVLPNNKAKAAMDVYYEITLDTFYAAIWDGTKTPEEAQNEIVNLAEKWYEENNK